ncbi:MAG: hypothetical protein ACKONH_13205 [Planctomycetia bacterium]
MAAAKAAAGCAANSARSGNAVDWLLIAIRTRPSVSAWPAGYFAGTAFLPTTKTTVSSSASASPRITLAPCRSVTTSTTSLRGRAPFPLLDDQLADIDFQFEGQHIGATRRRETQAGGGHNDELWAVRCF